MPVFPLTCNELRSQAEEHKRAIQSHAPDYRTVEFDFEPDPDKTDEENAAAEDEAREKAFDEALHDHEEALLEADELLERAANREGCI